MTDFEARELLRLSSIERRLRGFMKAFADEIDALACSLGHRTPDRVAADLRDLCSQMECVAGGSTPSSMDGSASRPRTTRAGKRSRR